MIPLIIFLIIISLFFAYLNGALSEISQEIFNRISVVNSNSKLVQVWDRYDEIRYILIFFQFFSLLISVFILGLTSYVSISNLSVLAIVISSLLIFVIVLINLIFYSLGKRFCEITIINFSSFIYFTTFLFVPIIDKLITLFMQISGRDNDDVSLEEITDLVEEAREDGSIDAGEYRLLKNVMNFNDILVSDVMTPRIVLFSCRATMSVAEASKLPELQMFSRFPVWNGESIDDEVVGYVITKEVFNAALNGQTDKPLSDLARQLHFVPENAELGKTLEELLVTKQHLYLVVDEYGGIEGLITMEDVLETMLGVEIVDEADKVVDLRALAKLRRETRIKENYNIYTE